MNPSKVDEYDYIQFLLAAQRVFSTVEASKVVSSENAVIAHDAYTRLLQRIPPDSKALWQEVAELVKKTKGVMVIDDTTIDKPYAEKMAMVSSHWSGKHHAVVMGINLISLLWTDEGAHLPCDFRLYNHSQDGLTKNDHFQNMLQTAHARGFEPELNTTVTTIIRDFDDLPLEDGNGVSEWKDLRNSSNLFRVKKYTVNGNLVTEVASKLPLDQLSEEELAAMYLMGPVSVGDGEDQVGNPHFLEVFRLAEWAIKTPYPFFEFTPR